MGHNSLLAKLATMKIKQTKKLIVTCDYDHDIVTKLLN